MLLNNKDYHARAEISKSDLDLLAKSPLHLKLKNELKSEPTPALILGSLVHTLVLERQNYFNEYILKPKFNKRTKDGKQADEDFLALHPNKTAIEFSALMTVARITKSVLDMRETTAFLRDGKAEQSYFSTINDVAVKCRPDFYNEALGLIVDLKTTSDASPSGFAKSVANFNYHIQAAFYTDVLASLGKEVNKFMFIAVETKAPFMVGFYELDEVALEQGRKRYLELLELYKYCRDNDEWWGYANFDGESIKAVQTLSLPAWKFYE
ncbi:PD-(D/E)XK nuclease-like domain-containing protein [Campylobacter suis]|uniref:Exodeoxyribonuclease 8 n=1 Tax=Campylobacter suis TaxID=2790657 RepID=A0ABN7K966_9BACT|nr:PD-(D/E)XK nuclease-like domain-containing protein [Campylobacter suis]CAD7288266.1 Exodeoxyribonuclease 8 [Campylobacter suis]